MNVNAAPCGSWKSPVTADMIVSRAVGLSEIKIDRDDIYWLESRPWEEGRSVIVRRSANGMTSDVTPMPYNARTRVHEYGGGSYTVREGMVYFTSFADQQVYRQKPGSIPVPLTAAPGKRFADFFFDTVRNSLVCVCEDHTGSEVLNSLVRITLTGRPEVRVLVSGNDFYSFPRISPDGKNMVWITWNHPAMPWDSSELWIAGITQDGAITGERKIAGGPDESVNQPEYSEEGDLYFISDRSGWWNLYRLRENRVETVYEMQAEFAEPEWVFAESRYAFSSAKNIFLSYIKNGVSYLASLDTGSKNLKPVESPYTWSNYIRAASGRIVAAAGSPRNFNAIIRLDPETGKEEILCRSNQVKLDPGYISVPREIEFPTENGLAAHAFYYPPCNRDFTVPADELPPLLVFTHGGPTSASTNVLNLTIQYFTSRGFAVVNVNYGGSSGFGRAYRQRLNGQWGVVDVNDCLNCARYLIENGMADAKRIAIRGGSAGGYTTLAVLTFRSAFRVGASIAGVSDIEALARDTHKFESHYMDTMVGRYPEKRELYLQRSPIAHSDQLSKPVIFFQGAEDRIVLPSQSELMADALRKKGIPVAYLLFEHEQHGFRIAANIKKALEAELYFYSRILGFSLSGEVVPIKIENLDPS